MMKRVLTILFICSLFWQCSSSFQEKDLIGTWKVVEFNPVDNHGIAPKYLELARKEAFSLTYEINEDKSYKRFEDKGDSVQADQGTWEFDQGSKVFILTYDYIPEKYFVLSLNKDQMNWAVESGLINIVLERQK